MISEIWESIKNTFTFIYDNFISKLIKPMYFIFTVSSFYYFINYLIHYEILLAFGSLFVTVVCFELLEGEK